MARGFFAAIWWTITATPAAAANDNFINQNHYDSNPNLSTTNNKQHKRRNRYWECTVLPPHTKEGHCRLGWSLSTGSLQGPVGYDKSSYAYRDIAGSKVGWGLQRSRCWEIPEGTWCSWARYTEHPLLLYAGFSRPARQGPAFELAENLFGGMVCFACVRKKGGDFF